MLFLFRKRINKDRSFKGYREMVVSTMLILSWTSLTNKAVYTCNAKNKEGSVESRKAVVTNSMNDIFSNQLS